MIPLLALIFCFQAQAADRPLIVQGISQRIATLDPFTLTGIEQYTVTGHVIEPLAHINPFNKDLIPCLAKSWTRVGKAIQLELREDAVFHNGQPFTSDDVKFTYDSYYNPKFKAEIWQGMFRKVDEVKVIDRTHVNIVLKEDLDYESFRTVMTTMRILPRSAYEKSDAKWRDTHLVGTGPFKLKAFDASKSLDLEPHDKWWGDPKPSINLKVKPVSDYNLAEMMYKKKELDFFQVPTDDSMAWKSKTPKRILSPTGIGIMIGLNLKKDPLKDSRVRAGLMTLWNRKALKEKLFGDEWELAQDAFSPNMEYTPRFKWHNDYEPKKVLWWFAKAGWKDTDKDSILDKKGKKFEFDLLVHDAGSERWASLFQADAAKFGVKVNLVRIDEDSQWWKVLKEGKFDAVADSGPLSDEVHYSTWHSKGEYNFYGYGYAKLDLEIDDMIMDAWIPGSYKAAQERVMGMIRAGNAPLPGLVSRHALFLVSPRLEVDEKFPTQAWRWRTKL